MMGLGLMAKDKTLRKKGKAQDTRGSFIQKEEVGL